MIKIEMEMPVNCFACRFLYYNKDRDDFRCVAQEGMLIENVLVVNDRCPLIECKEEKDHAD
mgnify:CR=1 FL=1